MTGLSLLCSYPKSGNTWLRAVLAAVVSDLGVIRLEDGLPFKALSARSRFDELMGIDSSDLTAEEIDGAKAAYSRAVAETGDMPRIWKVHDCFHPPTPDVPRPFPPETLASVVYVVRDPRDVAVSFAHHAGTTIDEIISLMGDPTGHLARSNAALKPQLPQYLSSWSTHVESWLDAPGIHLHLMRYEDMIDDPALSFSQALAFLRIDCSAERLDRALAATRFDTLRAAEREHGFSERPRNVETFFRRGVAGGWRDSLTSMQAARIEEAHGRVMQRLGYGAEEVEG